MAVDLGSRPFSTVYRPFRGSDEWVRIEWFPCAPGAKDLPFESNITNPFWERDQYEFEDGDEPLEEVIPTGKPRVKPGTGRGHFCGTEEDFREGGLYLPDDPPVLYGRLGLPACCNPPVVMQGGVEDGGWDVVPVVPGNDCFTAAPVEFDQTYIVQVAAAGGSWLILPLGVSSNPVWMTSTYWTDPGPAPGFSNLAGDDCSFLVNDGPVAWSADTRVLLAGGSGVNRWIAWAGMGVPKVYTVRFSLSPP